MTDPVRIVVMGVSGSGKSLVGERLARVLALPFVDGDDLHPAANVQKMRGGIALDAEDRLPWLRLVAGRLDAGPCVVACSALTRGSRDLIRAIAPETVFVELDVPFDILERRMAGRTGHFMPSSLLVSQLETLEPLADDERGARVDASRAPHLVGSAVLTSLRAVVSTTMRR